MRSPSDTADYCIGIAGAGAMGQGIAQVAIQGGIRTLLFDALDGAADAAAQKIQGRLDRLVEKERLDRKSADAAASRLELVGSIGAFADCDTVIEAIIEDIDAKQTLFRDARKRGAVRLHPCLQHLIDPDRLDRERLQET